MPRHKTRLPVEDVQAAIKETHGNVTRIAEHFGVERSVIYLKIRSKPVLIQAMADERETWKDLAEANVYAALKAGDWRATAFVLTCLARDRGWQLPKNAGTFGDGEPGHVDTVNVTSITINAMESNTFATDRSQAVVIRPVTPTVDPDASDDDPLLIEGTLATDDDDQ